MNVSDDPASTDPIRSAIQAILDNAGDGWTLSHYLVAMGLERMQDGVWESVPWLFTPACQPEWVADGLLRRAEEIQYAPAEEDTE